MTTPLFDGEESYIAYPPLTNIHDDLRVELEFKPLERDGVMFFCGGKKVKVEDFIAVSMVDGHVEFRYELGTGKAESGSRPILVSLSIAYFEIRSPHMYYNDMVASIKRILMLVLFKSVLPLFFRTGNPHQSRAGHFGPVAQSCGRAQQEGRPPAGRPRPSGEEDFSGESPGPQYSHIDVPWRSPQHGHPA